MATLSQGAEEVRAVAIGRVLGRAFAVMRADPVTVFGLAFVLAALPRLLLSLSGLNAQELSAQLMAGSLLAGGFGLTMLGGGLTYAVGGVILQGALVRAALAHAEGGRAGAAECLRTGLRVALPLLGVAIIYAVGVGIGLLLLLVPGVMLYLIWSVAAPALVEERLGVFAAFSRSAALTRGARWRILGLMLVALVLLWLVSAMLGVVLVLTGGGSGAAPLTLALSAVTSTFLSAFTALVATSLYVELRQWKEGPGNARLADVFA